jgi:hypothetical protein
LTSGGCSLSLGIRRLVCGPWPAMVMSVVWRYQARECNDASSLLSPSLPRCPFPLRLVASVSRYRMASSLICLCFDKVSEEGWGRLRARKCSHREERDRVPSSPMHGQPRSACMEPVEVMAPKGQGASLGLRHFSPMALRPFLPHQTPAMPERAAGPWRLEVWIASTCTL